MYGRLAFSVEWLSAKGLKILLILIGAYFLFLLIGILINRIVKLITRDKLSKTQLAQRAETLGGVLRGIARFVIIFMAAVMVLREVGVDPTPVLAGAGIAGLAVGFGAQNLVRDVINGFFILFEDHFGVGDVVEIGTSKGKVEHMNLRVTQLRDIEGRLHIIPNGEIKKVTNFSKEWARAVVDIGVSCKQDLEKVFSVIGDECDKLYADKNLKSKMLGKPEVLGVQEFGSSGMTIRILAKTKPAAQGDIERELRKRIKLRFDAEKVEMPFP